MAIPTRLVTDKYSLTSQSFDCHHCGVRAQMLIIGAGQAEELYVPDDNSNKGEWCADHQWQILLCPACQRVNVFHLCKFEANLQVTGIDPSGNFVEYIPITTDILYPNIDLTVPPPHPDMPDAIKPDYEEARTVFSFSPRSSAALLRLVIQKLCKELGEKGDDIHHDIGELVKKGLPRHVQQALDIVRVVGNNAVHPGQIDIRDDPEVAKKLFGLINEVVDNRIGLPQRQNHIDQIYMSLPEPKLKGIAERDKSKS